ncbi:MAG TPA: lipid II flippase MurJ, partial [Acidobacteriaceae bacterium]
MAEDTQLTPEPAKAAADSRPKSSLRRPGWLRLSHEHTAFSAMLLLMVSVLLARVIGLVRLKVIAFLFGAGSLTDAYTAAFQLPDMLTYLLAGGTASITFITILSRYR